MSSPDVCILKTDGINCDEEMAHAFRVAGAVPELCRYRRHKRTHQVSLEHGIDQASVHYFATDLHVLAPALHQRL